MKGRRKILFFVVAMKWRKNIIQIELVKKPSRRGEAEQSRGIVLDKNNKKVLIKKGRTFSVRIESVRKKK